MRNLAGCSIQRKAVLTLLASLLVAAVAIGVRLAMVPKGLAIDETLFPDEVLRVQVAMAADLDGDERLSDEELAALKVLHVTGAKRVSGLEIFPALEELVVEGGGARGA